MIRFGTIRRDTGGETRVLDLSPVRVRALSRGYPYGEAFSFGIKVAGAVVTVYPGTFEAGGAAYTTVATDITIAADGQYIGLAHDRSAGTVTITGPHNTRPTSSGDVYRTALYIFDLPAAGRARFVRCCLTDIRMEAIV